MKLKYDNIKFDFDDILIEPQTLTSIKSRYQDINPFTDDNMLPLFTAPMDTVIDDSNEMLFRDCRINPILPRTILTKFKEYPAIIGDNRTNIDLESNLSDRSFISVGLSEFEEFFIERKTNFMGMGFNNKVLIDVANGHMVDILKLAKQAKEINPELIIMAGNIANPDTYQKYIESEAIDYVRVGIGNGGGCLTTQQTGIGYPKASLIADCYYVKKEMTHLYSHERKDEKIPKITKIVADGGMKKYSDVIKALALGADYVMLGSILNKTLESCAPTYQDKKGKLIEVESLEKAEELFDKKENLVKLYRGMSTKAAQRAMGKSENQIKTSEGVVRYQKVEYTLLQWIENFTHYLRSAMSYCDARTLDEFKKKSNFIFITENAFNRFKK